MFSCERSWSIVCAGIRTYALQTPRQVAKKAVTRISVLCDGLPNQFNIGSAATSRNIATPAAVKAQSITDPRSYLRVVFPTSRTPTNTPVAAGPTMKSRSSGDKPRILVTNSGPRAANIWSVIAAMLRCRIALIRYGSRRMKTSPSRISSQRARIGCSFVALRARASLALDLGNVMMMHAHVRKITSAVQKTASTPNSLTNNVPSSANPASCEPVLVKLNIPFAEMSWARGTRSGIVAASAGAKNVRPCQRRRSRGRS